MSENVSTAPEDIIVEATDQYLSFSLAQEEYAIDVLDVREIRSWSEPTPLPHTPEHVLGVINLRGTIIPVLDLRIQLGLAEHRYDKTTGVIVVQSESDGTERQVGLVVDRVLNVKSLESMDGADEVQQATAVSGRYVDGLRRTADGLVILVDLNAIVRDGLQEADEGTPSESVDAPAPAEDAT